MILLLDDFFYIYYKTTINLDKTKKTTISILIIITFNI